MNAVDFPRSESPIIAGLKTNVLVLINPQCGFARIAKRTNLAIAVAVLAIFMLLGALLQRPAINHASMQELQASLSPPSRDNRQTSEERARLIAAAANPPVASTLVNSLIYTALLVVGAGLQAAVVALCYMLSESPRKYTAVTCAFLNIAVICIGGYYVVSGVIVSAVFALQGVSAGLDAWSPSILTVFDTHVSSPMGRGILAAINPFLFLAFFLRAAAIDTLAGVGRAKSFLISSFLSVCDVAASGIAGSVF